MYIPTNLTNKPKIIIFSGAGLDAPSGIKTFRGTDGLWNNYKISKICDETTWKKNYKQVHEFYNQRRKELKDKTPNKAHLIIKKIIEKYGEDNVYNITMNISDFFERLNTPVLHLHGELTKMECKKCNHNWEIGYNEYKIEEGCSNCKDTKNVKPKVVFFKGQAPMYTYYKRALEYLSNRNSIIIVIGTQGNVIPISKQIEFYNCYKILCNLNKEKYINEKQFSEIYYENIETAMPKIKEKIDFFVKNKWDNKC
jgi:NAD-dependent deacetylase